MRRFKRSTKNKVRRGCTIVRIILIVILIGLMLISTSLDIDMRNAQLLIVLLTLLNGTVDQIVYPFIPNDFDYGVKVVNDVIIFEIGENDHRQINREFDIMSQDKRKVVLSDGVSSICIAYNDELLRFLNEIRK